MRCNWESLWVPSGVHWSQRCCWVLSCSSRQCQWGNFPLVYGENQSLKKRSQVFAFSFFQETGEEMFNSLQALT